MDRKNKDSEVKPARPFAPYRGSISGSGEGMTDEEALSILRKVKPRADRQDPHVEVIVGAEKSPAQTEMAMGIAVPVPRTAFGKGIYVSPKLYENLPKTVAPPRVVIPRTDLKESLRSILGRAKALRTVEDALGQGQSLRMRLLLDKSTIDLDLSREDSEDLEASLSDLIDKSID
jgi:hypothetical protein